MSQLRTCSSTSLLLAIRLLHVIPSRVVTKNSYNGTSVDNKESFPAYFIQFIPSQERGVRLRVVTEKDDISDRHTSSLLR